MPSAPNFELCRDHRSRLISTPGLSPYAVQLAEHWLEISGSNVLPRKRDLRPEGLGRMLANILIYEFVDRDLIRFRLAGSSFRVVHGRELTGTNFLDMMRTGNREAASRRMFGMLNHPCAILTVSTVQFVTGRTGEFLSFGLPLTDDTGTPRYSVHVSEYMSGDTLPSYGEVETMGAVRPSYIDIGAGIPDFEPPV
jgi:hypothetical protein